MIQLIGGMLSMFIVCSFVGFLLSMAHEVYSSRKGEGVNDDIRS